MQCLTSKERECARNNILSDEEKKAEKEEVAEELEKLLEQNRRPMLNAAIEVDDEVVDTGYMTGWGERSRPVDGRRKQRNEYYGGTGPGMNDIEMTVRDV